MSLDAILREMEKEAAPFEIPSFTSSASSATRGSPNPWGGEWKDITLR